MAQQNVEIYFKVEGLDGYITNLDELQKVLGKVDDKTMEAVKATEKLVEAGEDLEDVEAQLDALEGGVKVLAGSLEFAAGALGALGLEGEFFEQVESNVLNIVAMAQGTIDLTEGYRLLTKNQKLATIAQRAFNKVANANPYVLLATALLAVGAAFLYQKQKAQEAAEEQKRINEEFREYIKSNKEQNEELLRGADARRELAAAQQEINDLTKEEIQQRLSDIQTRKDEAKQILDEREAELRSAVDLWERLGNNSEYNQKQLQTAQDNFREAQKDYNDTLGEASRLEGVYNGELQRRIDLEQKLKEVLEQKLYAQQDLYDELYLETLSAKEQEETLLQELYDDRIAIAEGNELLIQLATDSFIKDWDALQKRWEQTFIDSMFGEKTKNQIVKTLTEIQDELYRAGRTGNDALELAAMEAFDRRTADIDAWFDEEQFKYAEGTDEYLALVEERNRLLIEAEKLLYKELGEIRDEGNEEQEAVLGEQLGTISDYSAGVISSFQDFSNAMQEIEMNTYEEGSAEAEAAAKKRFEANKKLAIATAIANTGLAISDALAKDATFPGSRFIAAAAAGAAGAAQVAAIRSTEFDSTSLGGGISSGQLEASLNYLLGGQQAGPTIQPGQTSAGNSTQNVVKAYVVATDVTSAQEANAQIENLARL